MKIDCFEIGGSASFSTDGGILGFSIFADNPTCFLETLIEAVTDILPIPVPGPPIGLERVAFVYDGVGGSIGFELKAVFFGRGYDFSFNLPAPTFSLSALKSILVGDPMAILDVFEDFINKFTLTFFDVTLSHNDIDWNPVIGDRNIAGTGSGVEFSGSVEMRNSAWARAGLFGGGFGVDLYDQASAGGLVVSKSFSFFDAGLDFKFDAAIRNKLAEDLATLIGDLASLAVNALRFLLSVTQGGAQTTQQLADDSCELKNSMSDTSSQLDAAMGPLETAAPERRRRRTQSLSNPKLGEWLETVLGSMRELLSGMVESLELTVEISERIQVFTRLRNILVSFVDDASYFFAEQTIIDDVQHIKTASEDVRAAVTKDMLRAARRVPVRGEELIREFGALIDVVNGTAAEPLQDISDWGAAERDFDCLLKKAPDHINRLGLLRSALPQLLGELGLVGRGSLATTVDLAGPAPLTERVVLGHSAGTCQGPATAVPVAARALFPSIGSVCSSVREALFELTSSVGVSELGRNVLFSRAITARQFGHAASLLSSSPLCVLATDVAASRVCALAIAALQDGCTEGPIYWIDTPGWLSGAGGTGERADSALAESLEVSLAGVNVSSGPRRIGAKDWYETTLTFDATLTARGRASCGAPTSVATLSARLTQRQLRLVFYTTAVANVSNELANATVAALRVRAEDGMLIVRPGGTRRWWSHHSYLFVDAAAPQTLHGRVRQVCELAAPGNVSAIGSSLEVRLQLEYDGRSPLIAPAAAPLPPTLAATSPRRPFIHAVAPSLGCEARCAAGLRLEARELGARNETASALSQLTDERLHYCLRMLQHDYADCAGLKYYADARFGHCMNATAEGRDADALALWLFEYALARGLEGTLATVLVSALDCETFTAAQARHCICTLPSSGDAPTPPTARLRTIRRSVGARRLPNATNRPSDMMALRERLLALGYGATSRSDAVPADSCDAFMPVQLRPGRSLNGSAGSFLDVRIQEHMSRVFLCAVSGVLDFESACDVARVNGNCAIDGVECPPSARTDRGTCLKANERCSRGLIEAGGAEHAWLRARDAPRWELLPEAGEGFECETEAYPLTFGTSWLVEALRRAGREYSFAHSRDRPAAPPFRVIAASTREGGLFPDARSHQTGLQIRLRLPVDPADGDVDWAATQAQVLALESAGFVHIAMNGIGYGSATVGGVRLCGPPPAWRARLCNPFVGLGEMTARVEPPSLARDQQLVPRIDDASVLVADDRQSAMLTVTGEGMGHAFEDVTRVAIGMHECALVEAVGLSPLSPSPSQTLTAKCTASNAGGGWIVGSPSVTTASAGEGIGDVTLTAFLEPSSAPAPALTTAAVATTTTGGDSGLMASELPATLTALGEVATVLTGGTLQCRHRRRRSSSGTCEGSLAAPIVQPVGAFAPSVPNAKPTGGLVASLLPLPLINASLAQEAASDVPAARAPIAESGDCATNEAKRLYDACGSFLLSPLFPFHSNDTAALGTPLLELAFGNAGASIATANISRSGVGLRHPSCTNDTTVLAGNVLVHALAVADDPGVPSMAFLPRSGAATDPASGLPEGLVIRMGPLAVHDLFGVAAPQMVEWTSVLVGPAEPACAGADVGVSATRHAYLIAWLVQPVLHELLFAALGGDAPVEPLAEIARLTEAEATLVRHVAPSLQGTHAAVARGEDPQEGGIPPELRGRAQGLHLSTTAELDGEANELLCMGAWLVGGAHPCVSTRPVRLDVFVPLFEADGSRRPPQRALASAYAVSHLGTLAAVSPAYLVSVSAVSLQVEDLRSKTYSIWGEQLARLTSLQFDNLAIALPTRADFRAWTSPITFRSATSQLLEEVLPADDPWLVGSAELADAARIHRLIHLMASGPWPTWQRLAPPNTWSRPLGMDCELRDVTIDYYYTLQHPRPALLGPGAMHAVGTFELAAGTLVEVGVQMDKQLGMAGDASPLNSGGYVASVAAIDGFEALEIFSSFSTAARDSLRRTPLPHSLGHVSIQSFFACISEAAVQFEGPAVGSFAHRGCEPGFHLDSPGAAFGAAARVRMDAPLVMGSHGVGPSFSFPGLTMELSLTEPADFEPAVRAGIQRVIGEAAFLRGPEGRVTRAAVSFDLVYGAPSRARMAMAVEAEFAHDGFDFRLLLETDFNSTSARLAFDPSSDRHAPIRDAAAAAWPSDVGVAIRSTSDTTNLYALVQLLLSMHPPQAAREPYTVPEAFKFVRLPTALSGCFAGRAVAGYCHAAGAHFNWVVGASEGLFGADADATITSHPAALGGTDLGFGAPTSSEEAAADPLVVTLTIRYGASLDGLLKHVVEGVVAALPVTMAAGARRYFEDAYISAARLRYSSSSNAVEAVDSAIVFELSSHLHCQARQLTIPLAHFDSLVWRDEALQGRHIEHVIGELASVDVLRFFGIDDASAATQTLDFNAERDIPLWFAEQNCGSRCAGAEALSNFVSGLDVCTLGMYLSYLEMQPSGAASALCDGALLWMERADTLRVAAAQDVACGVGPALSSDARLRGLESRLRAIEPASWMGKCTQLHDFLRGVRTSVELPSLSLAHKLEELEGMLGGLAQIWESVNAREGGATTAVQGGAPRVVDPEEIAAEQEAANAQILQILPHLLATITDVSQWHPVARALSDSVHSAVGVVHADGVQVHTVAHFERWGVALRGVIDRLSGGLPAVAGAFQSLQSQISAMLPTVQRVVTASNGLAAEISSVTTTLLKMRTKLRALKPEAAFAAMYRLEELEALNYTRVEELLGASRACVQVSVAWLSGSVGPMAAIASDAEAPTSAVAKIVELQEMLAARGGGTRDQLRKFTNKLAAAGSTLLDRLKEEGEVLFSCADAVSEAATLLPPYLEAVAALAGTPLGIVRDASDLFSATMTPVMRDADDKLDAITVLEGGREMSDALQEAAAKFTPEVYTALDKESTDLIRYFNNFGPTVITDEWRGYLAYADGLLRPAIVQLERVLVVFEVEQYWEHLRLLASTLLEKLDAISRATARAPDEWPPTGASTPSAAAALESAVGHAFDLLAGIQSELADAAAPGSTCLEQVECTADLQVNVRQMRHYTRELTQAVQRTSSSLAASMRGPLVAMLDVPDFATEVLPELEVLSMWARVTNGLVPDGTAYSHLGDSPIQQQFARALCMEMQLRDAQGRDASPPAWFKAPCTSLDLGSELLDTDDNPFLHGIRTSAEMSDLFETKMTEVASAFNDDFYNMSTRMVELVESADGASRDFDASARGFVDAFVGVADVFATVQTYVSKMPTIFDLKEKGLQVRTKMEEFVSLEDLDDLSKTTSGALLHAFDGTSSSPFSCQEKPIDCTDVPSFLPRLKSLSAQLVFDTSVPNRLNTPLTLYSGLGKSLCVFRTGSRYIEEGLQAMIGPLEQLTVRMKMGPTAVADADGVAEEAGRRLQTVSTPAPKCQPDDAYCLVTAPRGTVLYRSIFFPALYLHFFSLAAPAVIDPCSVASENAPPGLDTPVMQTRWTVPGLYSSYALQSSTFLRHRTVSRAVFQCPQYTHLLAYAWVLPPGKCEKLHPSLLAAVDPWGGLKEVKEVYVPTRRDGPQPCNDRTQRLKRSGRAVFASLLARMPRTSRFRLAPCSPVHRSCPHVDRRRLTHRPRRQHGRRGGVGVRPEPRRGALVADELQARGPRHRLPRVVRGLRKGRRARLSCQAAPGQLQDGGGSGRLHAALRQGEALAVGGDRRLAGRPLPVGTGLRRRPSAERPALLHHLRLLAQADDIRRSRDRLLVHDGPPR